MNRKKNIIFIVSIAIACIPLFLTFNRGINYFDEGYLLEAARRIVAGELPYRDFHFVYTPAVVYFLALFLRMGGQYVIVERLAALVISIFGVVFLGLVTRKLSKNTLLVFLVSFFYALWGPTHLNFLWPVMVVLPLVFIYLYFLMGNHFFLSGLVMAIILLSKHNFGAAIILSFFCSLLWTRYSKKKIFRVLLGFISVIIPFILHLLITGSFNHFINDMNEYTIQSILIRRSFSAPFPLQSFGKFMLYTLPGLTSLMLCILMVVQKKNNKLIFVPLAVLFLYLFGIFPTPDWPHLTPLISSMGVLFAFLPRLFGNRYRFFSYFLLVCMIGIGIYSILVRNYYRWEAPLIKHNLCFSTGPMKYMCLDEKNRDIVSRTLEKVDTLAAKESNIFTYYNNPIHYLLTRKGNPTRYIDFNTAIGAGEEYKVIDVLIRAKVRIIVTRFPPSNSQTKIISKFIESNYSPIQTTYEFVIWKRKD